MFQALRKLLALNMFWWRTSNSGQTSRSWLAFCSWAASCTLSSSANRFLSQKQADYFPAYSKVPNSRQQQREYFRSNMNYADKNRYFEQCSFSTLYKTKETYSKLSKHNQVYMTYPYSLREIYFDGNSNTSESLKNTSLPPSRRNSKTLHPITSELFASSSSTPNMPTGIFPIKHNSNRSTRTQSRQQSIMWDKATALYPPSRQQTEHFWFLKNT